MAPRKKVTNKVPDQQTIEILSNNFFHSITRNVVKPARLISIAEDATKVADCSDLDITISVQAANIAYLAFTASSNHGGFLTEEQQTEAVRLRQAVIDYDIARNSPVIV